MTSAGNPITLDLKTRYKVKGLGSEKVIDSVVRITTDGGQKITMVEDRWNNQLPEGAIAKVSFLDLFSVRWWMEVCFAWGFWLWGFIWWTWPWMV